MDLNLPTPTNAPAPSHNRFPTLATGLVLVVLAGTLAYFAWQKGLLPLKNPQVPLPSTQALPDRSLSCPLPASFCQGKDLYKESSLSAKLSGNTPLYAAFSGVAEGFALTNVDQQGKKEEFTLVSLNSKEPPLQALYYLKGLVPERKDVKTGEIITTSNGQPLNFLEGKSFVFVLLKPGEEGSLQPIAPPKFK